MSVAMQARDDWPKTLAKQPSWLSKTPNLYGLRFESNGGRDAERMLSDEQLRAAVDAGERA